MDEQMDNSLLGSFLRNLEGRLAGIGLRRRRRILADLRGYLEDALQEGARRDQGFDAAEYIAGLDAAQIAGALLRAEVFLFWQRTLAALSASTALGLLTAAFMRASGRSWGHALAFGAGHGLSVGFALFWFRDRWQRLLPGLQWGAAAATGALAGIPWAFMLNLRFDAPMVFYGAITGFLLERFSRSQRWTVWVADNLWITATAFLLAGWESRWDPREVGIHLVPWAMAFHATLQGGVALGLLVHRRIGLWFLEHPAQE